MSAASTQKKAKAIQASNGYADKSMGASCAWKCPVSSTNCSSGSTLAVGWVLVSMPSSALRHSRESELCSVVVPATAGTQCLRPRRKTLDRRMRGDDVFVSNRGRPRDPLLDKCSCLLVRVTHTFGSRIGSSGDSRPLDPHSLFARGSTGDSLLAPLLYLLHLVPVGLRIAHRFERYALHDRILERLLVRIDDREPFLLELVSELALALCDVGGRVRRRLARDRNKDLLVAVGELRPDERRDLRRERIDDVAGQDNVLLHFVELLRLDRRERILLRVDGAVLQREIDLGEGDRRGIGPAGFWQRQVSRDVGHA